VLAVAGRRDAGLAATEEPVRGALLRRVGADVRPDSRRRARAGRTRRAGDDLAQIRRYCKCAEGLLVIGRDHGIYRGPLPCSARCDEYQRNESSEGEPSHSFFHSVVSSLRDTGPAPVAQLKRQVPPGQATRTIFHESDEWKPGPRASDRT